MSRPQIFLGELFTALDELSVRSSATAGAVMKMLSLESAHELALAVADQPPTSPLPQAPPVQQRTASQPRTSEIAPTAPSAAPKPPLDRRPGTRATVERVERTAPAATRPTWIDTVTELSRGPGSYDAVLDPLIEHRQSRAVVTGLAAGLLDGGDIDLARAIDVLARGLPLLEVPRQREWSLRRGVQLLVDEGPGMAPFAGDTTQVVTRAGKFVPSDRFEVLRFSRFPHACRIPGVRGSRPWRAPRRGTPILILSDLGLADPGVGEHGPDVEDWLRFATLVRAEGCHLRTLTPYPTARYAPRLVRALRAIPWDRRTTAAAVRRALSADAS